jgi:hypothetical protein
MGTACIRYLKKREGKKSPDSIGKTHYVINDWAVSDILSLLSNHAI